MKLLTIAALIVLLLVAPARERGLKFDEADYEAADAGRSREGAWIEIGDSGNMSKNRVCGRSREGAWIEIDFSRCICIHA